MRACDFCTTTDEFDTIQACIYCGASICSNCSHIPETLGGYDLCPECAEYYDETFRIELSELDEEDYSND